MGVYVHAVGVLLLRTIRNCEVGSWAVEELEQVGYTVSLLAWAGQPTCSYVLPLVAGRCTIYGAPCRRSGLGGRWSVLLWLHLDMSTVTGLGGKVGTKLVS